jgi:hypothetical protein
LTILKRFFKHYNLENIKIKTFFKFIFYQVKDIDILTKLSYLPVNLNEDITLQNLNKIYFQFLRRDLHFNRGLYNYLKDIYKVSE